jgi:hypothetical protein
MGGSLASGQEYHQPRLRFSEKPWTIQKAGWRVVVLTGRDSFADVILPNVRVLLGVPGIFSFDRLFTKIAYLPKKIP